MKVSERSYRTKKGRPKSIVKTSTDGNLILVITSWGTQEAAEKASEEMIRYVEAARADIEVTSPFEFLTCLSSEANYLRVALLIANESLYRGENKTQYSSGIEVVALLKNGRQVAWAQVGGPNIFLVRDGRLPQPISLKMDLAAELGVEGELPALPGEMLGLDSVCAVQCGHFVFNDRDQLLLFASSFIPANFLAQSLAIPNAEAHFVSSIGEQMNGEPFWIGFVKNEVA